MHACGRQKKVYPLNHECLWNKSQLINGQGMSYPTSKKKIITITEHLNYHLLVKYPKHLND